MNTIFTTTPITSLEDLDITELLDNVFADGIDLKEVMALGLAQIEAAEKVDRKMAREQAKAEKKAAKQIRKVENAGINQHLFRGGINAAIGGLAVTAVVITPGVNVALAGLALTQGARAVRQGFQANQARVIRNAVRDGEDITLTDEQALRRVMGDARYEAVLGAVDAGLLLHWGLAVKDPVLLVCAGLDVLAAGAAVMIWGAADTLVEAEVAKAAGERPVGAHRKPSILQQVVAFQAAAAF